MGRWPDAWVVRRDEALAMGELIHTLNAPP
jgi:hypothetical protein